MSEPTAPPVRDSHCAACGAPYPASALHADAWPRPCAACGTIAYRNPLPVAVALLPVTDEAGGGLVVVTRTIQPRIGRLALPGGFIDHGEDWRHAVVRELREETGIEATADQVDLADALSSPDGHLLLFGLLPARPLGLLPPSAPTDETAGYEVLRSPRELAFPLHTEAVHAWFTGRYS
ncbi:NUDIX domain-containing protein [Streptomyces sp. NPDC060198]|uniref:NUDIX domain-containing protein n=1 Tax=Streptomyces sp. NPDC060198 TaxID=3347070 RepID=UPI003668282F